MDTFGVVDSLEWECEKCGFVNGLQILEDYGPVLVDICGGCDSVYELDYLRDNRNAQ